MDLGYYFGLSLGSAATVVVSTTVLYFVVVAVLSLTGQRLLSAPTSLELAVVTVLGAVVGRSLLGPEPSLVTGLVAIATPTVEDRSRAVALVVAGRPVNEELRRRRVTEVALWSVLRTGEPIHPSALAGVRDASRIRERLDAAARAEEGHSTT